MGWRINLSRTILDTIHHVLLTRLSARKAAIRDARTTIFPRCTPVNVATSIYWRRRKKLISMVKRRSTIGNGSHLRCKEICLFSSCGKWVNKTSKQIRRLPTGLGDLSIRWRILDGASRQKSICRDKTLVYRKCQRILLQITTEEEWFSPRR